MRQSTDGWVRARSGPLRTGRRVVYGRRMATVTVTDLILNFAEACRALVPAFDRAGVPWRDGQQYDNWDRVVEPLFKSLVTEPCEFQAVGEPGRTKLRTARYGFTREANAWVALHGDHRARFIALSSSTAPFTHVIFEDPVGVFLLERSRFVFVYNDGGSEKWLENVDLEAD